MSTNTTKIYKIKDKKENKTIIEGSKLTKEKRIAVLKKMADANEPKNEVAKMIKKSGFENFDIELVKEIPSEKSKNDVIEEINKLKKELGLELIPVKKSYKIFKITSENNILYIGLTKCSKSELEKDYKTELVKQKSLSEYLLNFEKEKIKFDFEIIKEYGIVEKVGLIRSELKDILAKTPTKFNKIRKEKEENVKKTKIIKKN